MSLTNKCALITGGSKGIGLAIAEYMLAEGMNVCITARNTTALQESADKLLQKYPDKVLSISSDVTDYNQMLDTVQQIKDKWNRLDVVIANAGVGHFAPIQEMTHQQWNDTIDINLTGVFNTVKSSLSEIILSKGYIITIASLAGTNFFARGAAYNASKFGLVGFTQAMMLDLREHDVKCSTIMPGSVSTYFNNRVPGDNDGWKIQPEDLGQMVIDLLKMHPRTLPSKIEVRPSKPPKK